MSGKIKHSDLYEDGLFDGIIGGATGALKKIQDLRQGVKELAEETKGKLSLVDTKTIDDVDKLTASLRESEKVRKTAIELEIIEQKLKQAKLKTFQDEIKAEQLLATATAKETAAKEKQAKAAKDAQREYLKLSRQLVENKNKVKDLLASGKALNDNDKELIKSTQELDARLKAIDKTVGDNQRSVGGYKDAIKEAIHETGLFGGTLGTVINVFQRYSTTTDDAGKKTTSFSGIAKAGLIALGITAVLALKQMAELNQAVVDSANIGIAKAKDLLLNGNPYETLERSTIKYRIELRKLKADQQSAALDEVDQNEINNDATISITERNAALEKAIELSKTKAKIGVQIAQKDFDLIDEEIKAREAALGIGAATNDLLDARTEKQLALNDALDQESDLERINSQRTRQRTQDEIINNIEILRSNKLSANAKVIQLEKEFNDEKNQLEERAKFAKKISDQNIKVQNEEFAIFQKGVAEKINVQEILAIQDEIQLKAYVRKNIASIEGTALEAELFKIVKQSQEAQIANATKLDKLKDEELKRTNRLLEINRELNKIILEDQVHDAEIAMNEKTKSYELANEEILKADNVFNRKLLGKRNAAANDVQGLIEADKQARIDLLNANSNAEKIAIENTIYDEKTKAAEIKKINEKLKIDLDNLTNDSVIKQKEASIKRVEEEKAIALKQREIVFDTAKFIGSAIDQALSAQSQKRQDAIDLEINQRGESIDRQERLAEKGLSNTLAFEEKKRAEAEVKKDEQKEKDVRRAKIIAYFNSYAELAKQDPTTAPYKALAQAAITEAIAGSFKDGVENFKGEGTGTSDSNLIRFSSGESVVTAKGTKENAGLATAMNSGNVEGWFMENLAPKLAISVPIADRSSSEGSYAHLKELKSLNEKISSLENTLRNKKESTTYWDGHGNMITTEVENGIKRTLKHVKKQPKI